MRGLVYLWGILSCRVGAPEVVFRNVQFAFDFGRYLKSQQGVCQVVIGAMGGNNRWTRIPRGSRRRYRLEREGGARFQRRVLRVPRSGQVAYNDGLRENQTREARVLRYARETSLPSCFVSLRFLYPPDCDFAACRCRFTRSRVATAYAKYILFDFSHKDLAFLHTHFFFFFPRRAQPATNRSAM